MLPAHNGMGVYGRPSTLIKQQSGNGPRIRRPRLRSAGAVAPRAAIASELNAQTHGLIKLYQLPVSLKSYGGVATQRVDAKPTKTHRNLVANALSLSWDASVDGCCAARGLVSEATCSCTVWLPHKWQFFQSFATYRQDYRQPRRHAPRQVLPSSLKHPKTHADFSKLHANCCPKIRNRFARCPSALITAG